jgi:hypothetical protein
MPKLRAKPGEGRLLEPKRVIAIALSTVPAGWGDRMLKDESLPVRAVLTALDKAGYVIVPKK